MITMEQCKIFSGLLSYEMVVGPAPSPKHRARLTGYLLNLKWGQATVREMIVADIRVALDLGALNRAADLLVVIETSSIGAQFRCKSQSARTPRRLRCATAPTLPKYSRPAALRRIGRRCNNKMLPPSISDGGLISRPQRSPPLPSDGRPALLVFARSNGALRD